MVAKRGKSQIATAPSHTGKKMPAPAAKAVAPANSAPHVDLAKSLAEAFLTNERINQLLLDMVEPRVWRLFPTCSSRRNIATSFAHIHNVRCMRVKASDPAAAPLRRLDRATVTPDEVRSALGASARAMVALIDVSVPRAGHVRGFAGDIVLLTCAAMSHEAHHRGQIGHWLRELGTPLSAEKQLLLWEWDKRWKEIRQ